MTNELDKNLKLKLLLYAIISAVSFTYFITPENAGISVPIFSLIQLVCLWFIVPDRRRLVLFIPIFIMSFNCFWSASSVWRVSNFIISAALYSCMFIKIDWKNDSVRCLVDIISRIFMPIAFFGLPFKWAMELNSKKAPVIKRVVIALVIAIPCALSLTMMLSNADMVFSIKTENFFSNIFDSIRFHTLFLIICGVVAGLYLFGSIYCAHAIKEHDEKQRPEQKGDMIIINILLFAILIVYTLFVIIQFKYLFAGSTLPAGLTYTEYARKGFFELLGLTGINIAAILIVVKLTKRHTGKWLTVTKVLCHYLCAVTIVLLVSSFYRMMLYTNDDGLTRLRFFVMGFLGFEAIGLLITFLYIARPKFNIVTVYLTLAMTYYLILNVVPSDNIIARNQIDKYFAGEREGLEYVFTLSEDAAPALEYLYENVSDEQIKNNVSEFFVEMQRRDIPKRWQRFNLSQLRISRISVNKLRDY